MIKKHPGVRNIGSVRRRKLKKELLQKQLNRCALCGNFFHIRSRITFDHIKPRSIYPEFALSLDNLQILCEACNVAKSNTDETNWRAS